MCIREVLQSRQVCFEWFLHRPVPGATRFAQSIHEPGRRVAKGVLVRAGDSYVLAVLPATTEFCRWVLAFQSLLAVDRFPLQSGVRLE